MSNAVKNLIPPNLRQCKTIKSENSSELLRFIPKETQSIFKSDHSKLRSEGFNKIYDLVDAFYIGSYDGEKQTGLGLYLYKSNGAFYFGNFSEGKREGHGNYYFEDGTRLEANYINNEPTFGVVYFTSGKARKFSI